MDYQVFLVTRIHEHYERSRDNLSAVVDGLAVSARVISAALIMVCVFGSFILDADVIVKQFGGRAGGGDRDRRHARPLRARPCGHGPAGWRELQWFPRWLGHVVPRIDRGRGYFDERAGMATAGAAKSNG